MIIQINGKLRDRVEVKMDTSKEEMESIALNQENVKKYIDGNEIVKIITVQNRLVNIVIKER